jgi:fructoselysine-6-P-deglycase FrlB-like protein
MPRLNSRSKRIAIVSVAAILVVGGGGSAFAFWTASGVGTGTATTGTSVDFTVSIGTSEDASLIPGSEQSVPFTVTNNATIAQTLSSVAVTIADAGGVAWDNGEGCSAADYSVSVDAPTELYGAIVAEGTVDGTVTVTMFDSETDQNACKSEAVPLHFVVG